MPAPYGIKLQILYLLPTSSTAICFKKSEKKAEAYFWNEKYWINFWREKSGDWTIRRKITRQKGLQ